MLESVTKCRTRETGDNRDRWQHEDVLDSIIYKNRPGTRRRCQRSDPSVRKFGLVRCPVNSGRATAAKTPPAHGPPASMSSSAQRLRQEPFEERSARMKCNWRARFQPVKIRAFRHPMVPDSTDIGDEFILFRGCAFTWMRPPLGRRAGLGWSHHAVRRYGYALSWSMWTRPLLRFTITSSFGYWCTSSSSSSSGPS